MHHRGLSVAMAWPIPASMEQLGRNAGAGLCAVADAAAARRAGLASAAEGSLDGGTQQVGLAFDGEVAAVPL
jgi:hypothetical protein